MLRRMGFTQMTACASGMPPFRLRQETTGSPCPMRKRQAFSMLLRETFPFRNAMRAWRPQISRLQAEISTLRRQTMGSMPTGMAGMLSSVLRAATSRSSILRAGTPTDWIPTAISTLRAAEPLSVSRTAGVTVRLIMAVKTAVSVSSVAAR